MLQRIGVIGGGTMGRGIAACFALHGFSVNLVEPSAAQRATIRSEVADGFRLLVDENFVDADTAVTAFDRIALFEALAPAVQDRDFIVEAAPEKMELKQALLAEIDGLAPADAIFATNTSSLPLAPMVAALPEARQVRTLVTHWYNPPLLMPLVEISAFGNMPSDLLEEVVTLHRQIGKRVAKVAKDVPGLIANRIQQAIAREVFSLIEQGVADAVDIDTALKFGPAFRYATTGQLEVSDFGGLDIWLTVGDNLLAVMDASKQASALLRRKVAEGKLGVKSGEGFYQYDPTSTSSVRRAFLGRLITQLKASRTYP